MSGQRDWVGGVLFCFAASAVQTGAFEIAVVFAQGGGG